MPGLASGIPPQAMMLAQLASGFLAPGYNQAQRLSSGLANLGPAAMQMMQMQQYAKAIRDQELKDAAMKRLGGNGSAYLPMLSSAAPWSNPDLPSAPQMSSAPATGPQASSAAPWAPPPSAADQLAARISAPPAPASGAGPGFRGTNVALPEHSFMGDATIVAPEAVIGAKLKAMLDPMGNMPAGIQELMILGQNPGLAQLKAALDPTGPEALLAAAGIQPGTEKAQEFLASRGRSQTMINMAQEKAFETAEGQRYSKEIFGPMSAAAANAGANLQRIQRAKDLLANVDTGNAEGFKMWASNWAQSLNVDPSKLGLDRAGPAEAFNAISNDFVLQEMERLKGVASDSDVKMLKAMVSSVGNTPEGNALILDFMERVNDRAGAVLEVAQSYVRSNNGQPTGVESAIRQYWKDNPLYSVDEAKNINALVKQSAGTLTPDHIKIMSPSELRAIDVTKLTPQQAQAYRLRALMLGQQGGGG